MKQTISLFFSLVLAFCLMALPAQAEGAVTVHSVDELIAAIAPGAEIHIAEGEYLLSRAATYGQRTRNPYVKWKELYGDGYALAIHDLDDLAIIGSGAETTQLISDCPEADILEIEDCTGVTLQGFTAGHTPQSEGCSAGVLKLFRSDNLILDQLGLFGCGSVGINAERIQGLAVTDCEIYDCSSTGMYLTKCESVSISNCELYRLGKPVNGWHAGYTVFGISNSRGVDIAGCSFTDSDLDRFLSAWDSQEIHMAHNRIADNSFTTAVWELMGTDAVVESSNQFENNIFSHWYFQGWDGTSLDRAIDENGEPVFTEDPAPIHTSTDSIEAVPVITGEQKQVRVSTVDELLAAIDSNTEIILTETLYDLSTASDYGKPVSHYNYTWEDTYDGPQLVISGVENFSIVSEDDTPSLHIISAVPRYAQVIAFRDCSNVMLRGFTAGHTVEPSGCAGGVLHFTDCANLLVENCDLYGCGILGVIAWNVENLQVANSCIYECSYGGISCGNCQGVTIGGCRFWDLGGPTFQLDQCTEVSIDGQMVGGNYYGD